MSVSDRTGSAASFGTAFLQAGPVLRGGENCVRPLLRDGHRTLVIAYHQTHPFGDPTIGSHIVLD